MQNALQWLTANKIRYVVENKVGLDGITSFEITLGGYDQLEGLKGALEFANQIEQ